MGCDSEAMLYLLSYALALFFCTRTGADYHQLHNSVMTAESLMSKTPYLWYAHNMQITDWFCILSQCLQGSPWLSLSLHWHLWKKQTVLHCSWIEQWPTVTRCHTISPPSDSVSFHSGRKWSRMFWNLCTTGLLVDHNIQELVSCRSDLFSYITVSPSELHLFSSSHENYNEKLTRLAQIKAFGRSVFFPWDFVFWCNHSQWKLLIPFWKNTWLEFLIIPWKAGWKYIAPWQILFFSNHIACRKTFQMNMVYFVITLFCTALGNYNGLLVVWMIDGFIRMQLFKVHWKWICPWPLSGSTSRWRSQHLSLHLFLRQLPKLHKSNNKLAHSTTKHLICPCPCRKTHLSGFGSCDIIVCQSCYTIPFEQYLIPFQNVTALWFR